jgi:hypothetical protein
MISPISIVSIFMNVRQCIKASRLYILLTALGLLLLGQHHEAYNKRHKIVFHQKRFAYADVQAERPGHFDNKEGGSNLVPHLNQVVFAYLTKVR